MGLNMCGWADQKKNRVCVMWCGLCAQKSLWFLHTKPDSKPNFCEMRATANRRRSTRNRRNRQQSVNQRTALIYSPKHKYDDSCFNEDGIFMATTRKRALPTAEQIEAKKMRKLQVQQRKYFSLSLRHKVINLWLHGANFNEWLTICGWPDNKSNWISIWMKQPMD